MKVVKSASARFESLGKAGKGYISTQSKAMENQPYGYNTRFEDKAGTNPEELIAAAHASCFTMALSFMLAGEGYEDGKLQTSAEVTLMQEGESFTVTESNLHLMAEVKGIEQAEFEKIANKAKENCPISKVLTAKISLQTEFSAMA